MRSASSLTPSSLASPCSTTSRSSPERASKPARTRFSRSAPRSVNLADSAATASSAFFSAADSEEARAASLSACSAAVSSIFDLKEARVSGKILGGGFGLGFGLGDAFLHGSPDRCLPCGSVFLVCLELLLDLRLQRPGGLGCLGLYAGVAFLVQRFGLGDTGVGFVDADRDVLRRFLGVGPGVREQPLGFLAPVGLERLDEALGLGDLLLGLVAQGVEPVVDGLGELGAPGLDLVLQFLEAGVLEPLAFVTGALERVATAWPRWPLNRSSAALTASALVSATASVPCLGLFLEFLDLGLGIVEGGPDLAGERAEEVGPWPFWSRRPCLRVCRVSRP